MLLKRICVNIKQHTRVVFARYWARSD